MNIYVGKLASDVKDEEINALFYKHGRVSSVKIIRDMFSQTSKCFGFVEMPGKAEAEKALNELNTFDLKGKKLIVIVCAMVFPRFAVYFAIELFYHIERTIRGSRDKDNDLIDYIPHRSDTSGDGFFIIDGWDAE